MGNDIKRLQNDFAKMAVDGKISGTEATGLITRAKAGKLTESEANEFKAQVEHYKDKLSPEAAATFKDFIDNKMKKIEVLDIVATKRPDPIGVHDPAVLPADKDKLEEQVIPGGQLFTNGVSGQDPMQNYIGDCYLMAAMSSVAQASPDTIKNAFKDLGGGKYEVTLYDHKAGNKYEPHKVVIDKDLPMNDWNGRVYASAKDPKELWPSLLEKAFAQRAGSYGKIEAGVPGDAMSAITGKPSTDIDLRAAHTDPNKVFDQIAAAAKAGKPITAATLSDASAAKYTGTNIYSDHTYSVWGTSVENGTKYVHLRNPWGESEPAGNGPDDGIFKLPLDKFMSLYSDVSING
jgi:hypothetical protein